MWLIWFCSKVVTLKGFHNILIHCKTYSTTLNRLSLVCKSKNVLIFFALQIQTICKKNFEFSFFTKNLKNVEIPSIHLTTTIFGDYHFLVERKKIDRNTLDHPKVGKKMCPDFFIILFFSSKMFFFAFLEQNNKIVYFRGQKFVILYCSQWTETLINLPLLRISFLP
jgi:hypothetical protein